VVEKLEKSREKAAKAGRKFAALANGLKKGRASLR